MKLHYFISGLPRSGSTLLSSILRQNPDFYADIASPVVELIETSIDVMTFSDNNLILDENKRKNICLGIFDGYYKDIENKIIFDSSRAWTKSTELLSSLFPYTKILCCVRDINWILNSFELISKKNPFYKKILIEEKYVNNVFTRCDRLMDKDEGMVFLSWLYLKEGYSFSPEMIYLVEYENLCKNPEEEMKKIYNFLNLPYFSHDFDNVSYSNVLFDKSCNLKDLHTVRKKVTYQEPKKVLPLEIWEKYSSLNMEFWKKSYNPQKNINKIVNKKFSLYQ